MLSVLVLAVLVFWAIGAYNRLMAHRNAIGDAWRQVDEPLRRRHEVLPELVSLLREPLPTEHRALDAVLAASEQVIASAAAVRRRPGDRDSVSGLALAERVLAAALERLHALLEQHPGLKGEPQVDTHVSELSVLDQRLVFRRQLFNQATHRYNEAVRQFPTSLLVPLFRFEPAGTL